MSATCSFASWDALDELHVPVRYPEVLNASRAFHHKGALCVLCPTVAVSYALMKKGNIGIVGQRVQEECQIAHQHAVLEELVVEGQHLQLHLHRTQPGQ